MLMLILMLMLHNAGDADGLMKLILLLQKRTSWCTKRRGYSSQGSGLSLSVMLFAEGAGECGLVLFVVADSGGGGGGGR